MADVGYITAEQAKAAKAKPLKVNIRPIGTQIYAADYFAEDVRRTLVAFFGEDGLYGRAERAAVGDGRINGGLSVRTTLDPNLQRMARRALIDGLVTFDREKGWRGARAEDRHRRRLGRGARPASRSRATWRPGASASCSRRRSTKAVVGLRPARQADGSLVAEREAVEIPFDEIKWARTGRVVPKAVTDVLQRRRRDLGGAQGPDQADRRVVADAGPRGRRRPRRHGPAHGPRARGGRRLLLRHQPVRPRAAGQAPAGLLLQAARLRGRARQRLQADQHRARRADRDRPGSRQGGVAARRTTTAHPRSAPRRCGSASRSRATR